MASEEQLREYYGTMSKDVLVEEFITMQKRYADDREVLRILAEALNDAGTVLVNVVDDGRHLAGYLSKAGKRKPKKLRKELKQISKALVRQADSIDMFVSIKSFELKDLVVSDQ